MSEKKGAAGKQKQPGQTIMPNNKNDGSITVNFGEDDLEILADFNPPTGNGREITAEYLKSALFKLNINYGIQWEAMENARLECNAGRKPVKNVAIARGDIPRNEVSEYYELHPQLRKTGALPDKLGNIDYRSYSPYTIVKKDQVLAQLRKRRPGKSGRDVHGVELPFGYIKPAGLVGGDNTRTENEMIIANIHGQLIEAKGSLFVQDTLVIKGAVGYTTGNIIFPGDVIIEGPVSDGFKIYSGGSVTIKQTFDVTDVITKTDLSVSGGIIGRGRALVKVGGNLRTKFIENCRVACRKAVAVDGSIVNSRIFSMENLDMGDKGMIVGGEVWAIHGIKTGDIGRKGSNSARLHCGIDFAARQEMEKQNNILRIQAAKLAKLREIMESAEYQKAGPEKRTKMEELLHRLEEEQAKAAAKVTALMDKINIDNAASVEAAGDIHPGTLIEICGVTLFVTEPLRKVRIKLNETAGKLVTEQI
ncbi:hypothetical protein AGMMS49928_07260 [Spirochaetia bacterium]|nr:hypothetical protein AGMMS49928_07260 [Spirochaetia bacterium]